MSDNVSGGKVMRELVAAVAGPRQWGDNRKSWLSRAAKKAGISYRSVRAIFYGEITDPRNRSVQLLKHAARERSQALASRFESIARGMHETDPDFYRADVLGLLDAARALRGVDSPGDDPEI